MFSVFGVSEERDFLIIPRVLDDMDKKTVKVIVSVHNIQGNSGFMRKMATFDVSHNYEGGTHIHHFNPL